MKTIQEQLTLHEGKRVRPYRCTAGYLSVAVGRNLDANGLRDDEIALMLANDIAAAEKHLDEGFYWWRTLNAVRQKVMVDMMFNLGPGKLRQFSNTLMAIRDGRYSDASKFMLKSKWASQVGQRAKRLAAMMKTGEDYQK